MTTSTVVVQPTALRPQFMFGPDPAQVTCGQCGKNVVTTTHTVNGGCAFLAACIVCLICWPLMWLPLIIEDCKDVDHSCPACQAKLGTYKRL